MSEITAGSVLLIIWGINLAVPLLLGVVSVMLHFYTRGRVSKNYLLSFQRWKLGLFTDASNMDAADAIGFMIIVEGLIAATGFALLAAILMKVPSAYLVIGTISIVLLILPRYFIDICHALKYSFKSRDSERIRELEKRLEEKGL